MNDSERKVDPGKDIMATSSANQYPKSEFIENVDEFMRRSENDSVEVVLRHIDELHQKYRFMEASLASKRARLKSQMPDIQNSLELIQTIQEKKDSDEAMQTRFMLCEQCYTIATVPPTDTANVMLEYPLAEAKELLSKNLETAQRNISKLNQDLDFLRDQITTSEVNMARIYNWDVQRRKAASKSST